MSLLSHHLKALIKFAFFIHHFAIWSDLDPTFFFYLAEFMHIFMLGLNYFFSNQMQQTVNLIKILNSRYLLSLVIFWVGIMPINPSPHKKDIAILLGNIPFVAYKQSFKYFTWPNITFLNRYVASYEVGTLLELLTVEVSCIAYCLLRIWCYSLFRLCSNCQKLSCTIQSLIVQNDWNWLFSNIHQC